MKAKGPHFLCRTFLNVHIRYFNWLHGGQQCHVKIDRIQQEHAPEDYKLNEWRYI